MVHINTLRQSLSQHAPLSVDAQDAARAAVALILRDGERGAEFLAIQRAERPGDPWSGHMALPGGRYEPTDRDLFATAARETHEEVGLDLQERADWLGQLDEIQAVGRGRVLPLIITPVACEIQAPITLALNHREVQDAVWIPLAALTLPEVQGYMTYEMEGFSMRHPAYLYQGYTIWGLTYRILSNVLLLLP